MCAVSMVGDYWKNGQPWLPQVPTSIPNSTPTPQDFTKFLESVSKAEFDKLKKEVEELRKLLEAAKKFDESTGQPHCEVDEKVAVIKAVAKALGVDLKGVLD